MIGVMPCIVILRLAFCASRRTYAICWQRLGYEQIP
jgi:hypothetical protein